MHTKVLNSISEGRNASVTDEVPAHTQAVISEHRTLNIQEEHHFLFSDKISLDNYFPARASFDRQSVVMPRDTVVDVEIQSINRGRRPQRVQNAVCSAHVEPRVHNPPECATPIQLCVGFWSSGIGSSDVMRTLHTSARPVSRQGTIVFDPRVPATSRVPLGCVRYYDAKIRFRSTKTLCRAGSGVAHSGGLCTLG